MDDKAEAFNAAQHIRAILDMYGIEKDAPLGILFKNEAYQRDVQSRREELKGLMIELENFLPEIREKLDFYDVALRDIE